MRETEGERENECISNQKTNTIPEKVNPRLPITPPKCQGEDEDCSNHRNIHDHKRLKFIRNTIRHHRRLRFIRNTIRGKVK